VLHLHSALSRLQSVCPSSLRLVCTSSLYESTPVGSPPEFHSQPRFLNAALLVHTTLSPLELLDLLKSVEEEMGRDQKMVRNGPRNIDLDLICTPLTHTHKHS
jgi:2-amino-4-hydroxy-6-hydroxymethyldihydropteridine diphosphokinase